VPRLAFFAYGERERERVRAPLLPVLYYLLYTARSFIALYSQAAIQDINNLYFMMMMSEVGLVGWWAGMASEMEDSLLKKQHAAG
jgi:hypothetical protein